jgi:hypothetical protein
MADWNCIGQGQSVGWTRHRDDATPARKSRHTLTSQDALFAGLAQRAVVEETTLAGAASLEVFAPAPSDATFVRERNVAPGSTASPVWSTPGKAIVALTPTSITVRFVPQDAAALDKRPAGPARIRAHDDSWEAVKGYGGLPQATGEVLFDGALLACHAKSGEPVAATRIVFAGAAWRADVTIAGERMLVVPLTHDVANHHDKRMALVARGALTHPEIADIARASGFVSGVETAVVCVERYAADGTLVESEHRRWTPRVGWSPHSPFTGVAPATQAQAFEALATALRASDGAAFPLRRVVDQICSSYNVRDIHFAAQNYALAIVTAAAHGYDLQLSAGDRERYEGVRAELLERGFFHDPGYETGRPQKDIKFLRDIADAIVLRSCGYQGTYYGSEHVTTLELAGGRK